MEQPSAPTPPSDDNNQPPLVTSPEVPELVEEKPLMVDIPTGEAAPTQPSVEEQGAAGPSSTFPEDEVFRVNKLLQIENMGLVTPAEASSTWFLDFYVEGRGFFYFIPLLLLLIMGLYFPQGFRVKSLLVWQASCVLRNYELCTGNVLIP